jgi:hypothetical protein
MKSPAPCYTLGLYVRQWVTTLTDAVREFRKFVFGGNVNIVLNQRGVDDVQNEDISLVQQEIETESGLNQWIDEPRGWLMKAVPA